MYESQKSIELRTAVQKEIGNAEMGKWVKSDVLKEVYYDKQPNCRLRRIGVAADVLWPKLKYTEFKRDSSNPNYVEWKGETVEMKIQPDGAEVDDITGAFVIHKEESMREYPTEKLRMGHGLDPVPDGIETYLSRDHLTRAELIEIQEKYDQREELWLEEHGR